MRDIMTRTCPLSGFGQGRSLGSEKWISMVDDDVASRSRMLHFASVTLWAPRPVRPQIPR